MDEHTEGECQRIWQELGPWWDAQAGDGDAFHRALVFPALDRLLNLKGGETVLDAGCGNGALTRRMAAQGARVLGVDFSASLLERARQRSPSLQFEQVDLTCKEELQTLSRKGPFDHVVCSMVLHDMPALEPFFDALRALLKPGGAFIFSIPHPCFNNPLMAFAPEGAITVAHYMRQEAGKVRSKEGQPIEQWVFLRPLQEYFRLLFERSMVLDGFEEPCAPPGLLPQENPWAQRPEIPPALIARWTFE